MRIKPTKPCSKNLHEIIEKAYTHVSADNRYTKLRTTMFFYPVLAYAQLYAVAKQVRLRHIMSYMCANILKQHTEQPNSNFMEHQVNEKEKYPQHTHKM